MSAQTFDAVALLIDEWRIAIDVERLIDETETHLRRNQ